MAYSDFLSLAAERFSVRKFKNDRIPADVMDRILRAGHLAPTGCNYQPQKIYVIQSEDAVERMKKCTRCHFDAPAAILVCYDKSLSWKRSRYDGADCGEVDASIVTTHMMLEAWEMGIGSCWVMYFDPEAMRREFSIPEEHVPVALLVMGYPAEDTKPMELHSQFRSEDEIVKYL